MNLIFYFTIVPSDRMIFDKIAHVLHYILFEFIGLDIAEMMSPCVGS